MLSAQIRVFTFLSEILFSGLFKDRMVQVLQKLRANRDIIMTVLSLFVKEPSIDWIKETYLIPNMTAQQLVDARMTTVRNKFDCVDPANILQEEIATFYRYGNIAKLKKLLNEHESFEKNLDEEMVATCLIDIATDQAILSRAYAMWRPYL